MGKQSEYYHSEIKVEDISFQPLFIDNNQYKEIIKKFNHSVSTKQKQELCSQLPNELFCYCRYCGKPIVHKKTLIKTHKDNSINIKIPSVKTRIIDNKNYELSCCEDCLLEHFKQDPPKSSKYYYMKGNKYGAYSFGYSEDEYRKIASMTVGVTEKSLIRKWGKEEGLKKWKEYCDKHSYIASKKRYIDKYGKEIGLAKYYEDRAMTLEMCIKRHGKKKGKELWNNYCERQRYTNSKEYYINKYGEGKGINKWKENRIIFAKAGQSNNSTTISKISQELFNILYKKINTKKEEIYFYSLNKEYELICDNGSCYFLDFYDKERNIIIEFNGDYWHANPKIYHNKDVIYVHGQEKSIRKIHKYEKIRKENICKQLNNPIYIIVWESDYKKDKEGTINNLLKNFQ